MKQIYLFIFKTFCSIFLQINRASCLKLFLNYYFADQATFARQALRVHNYFRHIHNSPPLGINEDLVRKALESAKGVCMKEKRSEIDDSSFGENVGIACNFASQTVSAAEAVTNW